VRLPYCLKCDSGVSPLADGAGNYVLHCCRYAQDPAKKNLHKNCTESGKSVQFQPISAEAKARKSNVFADTLSSIPTRASIKTFDKIRARSIRSLPCTRRVPRVTGFLR